jgi:hypothetical protein
MILGGLERPSWLENPKTRNWTNKAAPITLIPLHFFPVHLRKTIKNTRNKSRKSSTYTRNIPSAPTLPCAAKSSSKTIFSVLRKLDIVALLWYDVSCEVELRHDDAASVNQCQFINTCLYEGVR